jgi:uncharacterized protein YjbI with pentapeptide repeats
VHKRNELGQEIQVASLLELGDFHRLSGNLDRARHWYERIYSELNGQHLSSELRFLDAEYHAEVLFLLERYDEYLLVRESYPVKEQDHPEAAITTRICLALLAGNVSQLEEALEELAEHIRKYRLKPIDVVNYLHPWDRYEISLRRKAELEGRDVASLGPRELLQQEKEWQERRELEQPEYAPEPPPRKRLAKEQVQKILEEEDEQPDLYRTDLSELDLSGEHFTTAILVESDLRRTNLTKADMVEADLSGADLTGANLQGAHIQQAIMSGTKLDPSSLGQVKDKNLTYVDLSGTDLRSFDLSGVDLREAVLIEADLREANLTGSDLRGADLTGANLEGAILDDALH